MNESDCACIILDVVSLRKPFLQFECAVRIDAVTSLFGQLGHILRVTNKSTGLTEVCRATGQWSVITLLDVCIYVSSMKGHHAQILYTEVIHWQLKQKLK